MGRLNCMKRYHSQQQRNEVGASAGIYIFVIEQEEPYELRGSRTVP
jgi:hypothetical protein